MRILQVVTLISGIGAFGGPTRVAVNQCEALQARGHQTLLVGGADHLPLSTTRMGGAPVRVFPTRRIGRAAKSAYRWSPALLRWLRAHLDDFDVVHVHFGRDGVSLPVAALAARRGHPFVLQTHGMVGPRGGPHHRVVDRLVTLRVLQRADFLFALSDDEEAMLAAVTPRPRPIDRLRNGITVGASPRPHGASPPGLPQFLFLARLHPRKRAPLFVAAAERMLTGGASATFALAGPDDGDGEAVRAAIDGFHDRFGGDAQALSWVGPLAPDETAQAMARAFAYVLPSVDEPYPMSVIEAMAAGLPVIVTETNGLASVIEQYGAGVVIPGDSVPRLHQAMEFLLADPAAAATMGGRAREAVERDFGIDAVAATLEDRYTVAVGRGAARRRRAPRSLRRAGRQTLRG